MENDNKESGLLAKIFGLLFALIALPFRFFAANPKVFAVFLVILASVGGTIYIARTNPSILGIQTQTVDQTAKETEELIDEVGKIIALPQGETPTIATVSDVEAVKDQTFFAKAQNGDRVLIYPSMKKAYLYRPSEKKIIEVGVVNLGQSQANTQEETQVQEIEESEDQEEEVTPSITTTPTSTITPTPTNTFEEE